LDLAVKSFAPVVRPTYPHMMPEDTVIWTKFISNPPVKIDEVWYDVRVGAAVPVPTGQPGWMTKFSEYSTRKRIDIVWLSGLNYWVVEAKPHAGLVALGQVLFYAWAFEREHRPEWPVIRGIVTDIADEDLIPVFEQAGIVCFEVGLDGD